MQRHILMKAAVAVSLFLGAFPALAEERGPVTKLPLPRYVSLKVSEANVRRGPSKSQRIDWVYQRRNMPLQVTAEHENWRRVRDRDGAGGWIHYALLSGVRTVLIEEDLVALYNRPDTRAPIAARLQLGVIARVDECGETWCHLEAGGYDGWAQKSALWGVDPGEVFE